MNKVYAAKALAAMAMAVIGCIGALNHLSSDTQSAVSADSSNVSRQLITAGDPLRIGVFGSSQSWGASLEDRFNAYPYRLSPRVDNFAYFAAGPNYPAVCAQSVIGDHAVYDLLILEYYVSGAEHGLADLARRLRERFPEAIIIVMKFYGPFDAVRANKGDPENWQELNQWKQSLNLPNGQLNEFINEIDNDKTGIWRFREHPNADKAINKAVREIGGYQFHLPSAETPAQTLVSYLRFFDKEQHQHLSDLGHEWVANMCAQIVKQHILEKKKPARHVAKAAVGTWGKGDLCNIWWTTGGLPHPFSENIKLNQYDENHGKFALEFSESGWVEIENPFEDARTLYLTYVATDTPGMLPSATASYSGQSFELDSDAMGHDIHGVGVSRTVAVGSIPAGATVQVTITPKGPGSAPFRLVGTTISNGILTPLEWGFGPNFNRGL